MFLFGICFMFYFAKISASNDMVLNIFSQGSTDWGYWGERLLCPYGIHVTGYRLQVQDAGPGDDTGLNGIQLACADGTMTKKAKGPFGEWKPWQYCGGSLTASASKHIVSFKLKSQSDQGRGVDDTAANNVNFLCDDQTELEGDGTSWGEWESKGYESCSNGNYFCGVEAQIEGEQHDGDDTGLNQLKFLCCAPISSDMVLKTITQGNTDWGDLGERLLCPYGVHVVGYRLQVQDAGPGDDTGMNGIQLACADGTLTNKAKGPFGEWKPWHYCEGRLKTSASKHIVSFKLKSEANQGPGVDDTAANNVNFLCDNQRELEGDGTGWGEWDSKGYESCSDGKYFCGVETRIEADQHDGDDTGLNQLNFLCCLAKKSDVIQEKVVRGRTGWGDWGQDLLCPHGVHVAGYRLQVRDSGPGDDTGLNGIQLACADGSVTKKAKGPFGEWKAWQYCEGSLKTSASKYVVSFKLKSEGNQGASDDTAANNVNFLCDDDTELEGDGTTWGDWEGDGYESCSADNYFCGVQARIEKDQQDVDDTGLNQMKFLCCAPVKKNKVESLVPQGRTDWGDWGEKLLCAPGIRVAGYRLQVQELSGGDDTGLNGIQLACADGMLTRKAAGPFGEWKEWQYCEGALKLVAVKHITSFNLKSEDDQGSGIDDTGANNVNFLCSDATILEGDGTDRGKWESDSFATCSQGNYFCGVQARIQADQQDGDDTGMDQMNFLCCVRPKHDMVWGEIPMGLTDWGDWGEKLLCAHGIMVAGFRLQVQDAGPGDDTGMNGIQLACADGTVTKKAKGPFGEWKPWKYCEGTRNPSATEHIIAFRLKSESNQGRGVDDTAVNNVDFRCDDHKELEGDGTDWGEWEGNDFKSCSDGNYFCGVQARIEEDQHDGDDTGLNQLKFLCCVPKKLNALQGVIFHGRTSWGDWSEKLLCGPGVRVAGFRLQVQDPIVGDDTALNGIQLACADGTVTKKAKGPFGEWKPWKYCEGSLKLFSSKHIVSFKLRSESDQGRGVDDTGANNINFVCNDMNELEGDGTTWGKWENNGFDTCPAGNYFCGVQARIEADQHDGDDTGLNQMRFICCDPMKNIILSKEILVGKTDYGRWSRTIMCEKSGQVSGFRLRVEHSIGGDDTALNGIQLVCRDGSVTQPIQGSFGSWEEYQLCDESTSQSYYHYVMGFNFRSEGHQFLGDDTAGNNVKMICNNNKEIDGGGTSFGTWEQDDYIKCPHNSFLCGVQAKVEDNQGDEEDDTALNKLRFLCCTVEEDGTCPIKVEPLGCFVDKRDDRTMEYEILNERDPTNPNFVGDHFIDWFDFAKYLPAFRCRCAMKAASMGYKVFGIQMYAECWSGSTAHIDYDKHGETENCVDTQYQTISHDLDECPVQTGIDNSNYAYTISSITADCNVGYAPVGCYEDFMDVPRPVPNYEHNERDESIPGFNGILIDWNNWNSYFQKMICRCAEAARKLQHEIFAIQFWGECWTSFKNETEYDRDGPSTRCRGKDFKPCTCNCYHCVGMHQSNYVYKTYAH